MAACERYGIELVQKELTAAPLSSPEGRHYLSAMAAAANFAFTNRPLITYWVRRVFTHHFGELEDQGIYVRAARLRSIGVIKG